MVTGLSVWTADPSHSENETTTLPLALPHQKWREKISSQGKKNKLPISLYFQELTTLTDYQTLNNNNHKTLCIT